ncbi:MAG: signal peptidase I [Candidatus Shapirobacteria bacterium]|nr:signal peptidase I [Candidatus Shapirobacteria bacterium]MDD5481621.1 signal peptidase I [Candidatus Shapirobacteria bacterium]
MFTRNKSYRWFFLLFIFSSLLVLMTKITWPGKIRLFTVQSGSMAPAINPGDLILVREEPFYQVGDIITFADFSLVKRTTTHRIVEINWLDEKQFYLTKGDANPVNDPYLIEPGLVLGKVFKRVNRLGFVFDFISSREGKIFLLFIPALVIVGQELMVIIFEIKKESQERS